MYHRFVKSTVRSTFMQISAGNWEPMMKAWRRGSATASTATARCPESAIPPRPSGGGGSGAFA